MMIEARQLSKSFNDHKILDKLDLTIRRGETLVIIGRSGCGKSVFLKHIIGIIRPDQGDILVDGVSLSALSSRQTHQLRMRFGMLFQGAALFDSMTVGENVGFALIEHTSLSDGAKLHFRKFNQNDSSLIVNDPEKEEMEFGFEVQLPGEDSLKVDVRPDEEIVGVQRKMKF